MTFRAKFILASLLIFSAILSSEFSLAQTTYAQASSGGKLKTFLTASAYGAVAGSLIGVASLAFISDPSSNLMNIAKGASLGLYAGMIYGCYSATSSAQAPPPPDATLMLTPQWNRGQVSGAEVSYLGFSF